MPEVFPLLCYTFLCRIEIDKCAMLNRECDCDCFVTLRQLNYASDIYSSDTLRQVITNGRK